MRDSRDNRSLRRPVALTSALCALILALPLLSSAVTRSRADSINVVNGSSRQIIHVYLSPVDSDNWGAEQLHGAVIAPGQSFEVSDVTCSQSQVKVVAEDGDGCFLSAPVGCGGESTWTITNDTAADCGGQ